MSDINLYQLFEIARINGYMDTETQQTIFKELARHWSCFTLNGNEFVKANGLTDPDRAKAPRYGGWNKGCTERIEMTDYNTDMMGIPCGPHNTILVLDIDDEEKFNLYVAEHGWTVPNTFKVKTGDGYHLYYRYPEDGNTYRNRSSKLNGFDIRGLGGYVVAPGSTHPNGNYYDIVDFNGGKFEDAPQWLLNLALEQDDETRLNISMDNKVDDANLPALRIEQVPLPSVETLVDSLPEKIRTLIKEGKPIKERSEAVMAVLVSLIVHNVSDDVICQIFATYKIGERCKEKGPNYLSEELARAKDFVKNNPPALMPDSKKKSVNVELETEKIISGYKFFQDEEEKIHCRVNINGNTRYLHIDSLEFVGFIRNEIKTHCGVALKQNAVNELLYSLKSELLFNNNLIHIDTMKRFYHSQGKIWYDSGHPDKKIYEITPMGVNLIPQSEILLRVKSSIVVDVDTNQCGLDNFSVFLNSFEIHDPVQRHYLLAHILSFLFDNISTPILYLYGGAGNGKTTFASHILNVFDPKKGTGGLFTGNIEDFVTQASNRSIVFLDNFDRLSGIQQDYLCQSFSDGYITKRKKFSDNDDITIFLTCSVILASIEVPYIRDDLRTRIAFINIIPKNDRVPLDELKQTMTELLPKIRGELLNLASSVLGEIDKHKASGISRHSGFERLVSALIAVLAKPEYQSFTNGSNFDVKQVMSPLDCKDNSIYGPVINEFIKLIKENEIKFFTMAELEAIIKPRVKAGKYSGNDATLSKLLKRHKATLERLGIFLVAGNKINKGRVYMAYDENSENYPFGMNMDELLDSKSSIVTQYIAETTISPSIPQSIPNLTNPFADLA